MFESSARNASLTEFCCVFSLTCLEENCIGLPGQSGGL